MIAPKTFWNRADQLKERFELEHKDLSNLISLSENQSKQFLQKQSFSEHIYVHLLPQIIEWNENERLENIEHAKEKYKDNPELVHLLAEVLFRKDISTRLYKLFQKEKEE